MSIRSAYSSLAKHAARVSGHPGTFSMALCIVAAWAVSGPLFGFSDTWQLVINTGTTIITFLMVFLIQNTQSRDTEAMHLKLDELIRAHRGAHNALLDLEELSEEKLDEFKNKFQAMALKARKTLPQEEGKTAHRHPRRRKTRPRGGNSPKAGGNS
jgi:low affinity Fe/Cu permease